MYFILNVIIFTLYLKLLYTASVFVMVSVRTSSVVDREFEPRSGQTKDYKIDICFFSAKHAALRRIMCPIEDDVFIRRLLFQWTSTIQIQLSLLV